MRKSFEVYWWAGEQVVEINWTPSGSAASWTSTTRLHILDLIFQSCSRKCEWKCEGTCWGTCGEATRCYFVEPKYRLNAALANCSLGRIGVVTGAFPGFLLILHLSTFCISNYPFSTSSLSLCWNISGIGYQSHRKITIRGTMVRSNMCTV